MKKTITITSSKRLMFSDLLELRDYKDLIYYLFRKEVIATYKQSIFGILWFFAQPISLTLVYYFVFSEVANLKISSMPPTLFYLSGVVVWSTFLEIYTQTATSLVNNASLFNKVYFPRLIAPLATTSTVLLKTVVQFFGITLFCIYSFYFLDFPISFDPLILLSGIFLIVILAMGLGLIVASLSVSYKDIKFILNYLVGLLMYVSPVMYSIESLDHKYSTLIEYNPLTSILCFIRGGLVNDYPLNQNNLFYAIGFCFICFIIGIFTFGMVEKDCVDKV